MVTLDLNYGITDRLGIEVAIPYMMLQHQHIDGLGEDNGGAGTAKRFTDIRHWRHLCRPEVQRRCRR